MVLHPGVQVPGVAGKVMALLQGNDIFHITGLNSSAQQQACQECRSYNHQLFHLHTSFDLSTHIHKYDDVCWERDGAQIEA